MDAPYRSIDFFMKMPAMIKNSGVILDAAGEEFISWKARLCDTIDYVMAIDDYLATERLPGEEWYDGVIRSMILCSVNKSFILQLDRTWSAKKTFDYIQSMFHFPSRMTHVTTWNDLLATRFEPGDLLNNYLTTIRSKIDELDWTSFEWMKDSILRLAMQLGLPKGGDMSFSNVNMVLDARLRNAPSIKVTACETEEVIRAE
ncbi:hypothetical protein CROQUDRAFT_33227, partial [Cronartium quercuum f. sp. fusiforme G11]